MQMYDLAKVSENVVLGLMREVLGYSNLRNLNAAERVNFPGLDLVDDVARVGIQVTLTPTLDKIRSTVETCKKHGLDQRIDRLVIYVLTRRQDSYSQDSIDRVGASFSFDTRKDILDFRDLSASAADISPVRLKAAVMVLEEYLRGGIPAGLAPSDFDPPTAPAEKAVLNLLELFVPPKLYVADLLSFKATGSGRRQGQREKLRTAGKELGLRLPSDFMVSAQRLITFHPLDQDGNPFEKLIDVGTATPLGTNEFCKIDPDHERILKGLLRFSVQQKLFKHRVQWMHDDNLFVFMPLDTDEFLREASWVGLKQSTRRVFEKKLNKKDPSKVFHCKHFAFSIDFVKADAGWYVALAPDWYFSNGTDFRRSIFADDNLSWIKRKENNRAVLDHFRFLSAWLKDLDQDDLFDMVANAAPTVTFGNMVTFTNHPPLDDESWLPVRAPTAEAEGSDLARLFDEP